MIVIALPLFSAPPVAPKLTGTWVGLGGKSAQHAQGPQMAETVYHATYSKHTASLLPAHGE